jgi:cheR methyltransferase, SAM binding domain
MFTPNVQDLSIKEIRAIIAAIRVGHGDDFSDFNLGVLSRRVAIAMNRLGVRQTEVFCQMLQGGDLLFYKRLLAEITPPTTELLRDPSFWLHLREDVLPSLNSKNEKLKILQAAYDTGEELYSLLIVLEELKLRADVELTSVYLSEDTLTQIRNCKLPSRRQEVDKANFARFEASVPYEQYISSVADTVQFRRELLADVHFLRLAPVFNLPADPKYHLILCRNQFLYFNPQLGIRNMQNLFDRLRGGGILVLGAKECLDSYQNGSTFTVLNREESIYRKRI